MQPDQLPQSPIVNATILLGTMVCVFAGWFIVSMVGEKIAAIYLVYLLWTSIFTFPIPFRAEISRIGLLLQRRARGG